MAGLFFCRLSNDSGVSGVFINGGIIQYRLFF